MTCVWTPDEETLSEKFKEMTPEKRERALFLASSSLQTLTYGRVGTCPITIRPVPSRTLCGCGFNPHKSIYDGRWYNSCAHRSRFAPTSEIDIPGPVGYIDAFIVNGVAQDLESPDWRLDNGHLLVWQGDGPSPLPIIQDLDKPDTAPNTFSITYSQSYPVALDGRIAVAVLAMEFAAAMKPNGKCSLPKGVTSVVRSGVSFTIEAGLFPNGLTGNETADQFILKWAPAGSPTQSATVFDPRTARPRVTSKVPTRSPSPGLARRGFGE